MKCTVEMLNFLAKEYGDILIIDLIKKLGGEFNVND